MELSHEDVLEILELLDRSNVEYLELDVGGTRLVADKSGTGPEVRKSPAEPHPATSLLADSANAPADSSSGPAESVTMPPARVATSAADSSPGAISPQAAPDRDDPDVMTVTAPVVGIFYRSPEPGAPPFTEAGEQVDEDSTVGLIEVMKMFNSVTAGVRGTVVKILAENEAFVEYGQPLITIRPEPG